MTNDMSAERHIVCELRSKPEHRERVKELLLDLVGPARNDRGNLSYNVFQDGSDPNAFFVVDGWATQEDYMAHHHSENVARVVEKLSPLLVGTYVEHVGLRFSPA